MKNILVTGSIAYDHLMTYDGHFNDAILPEELDNLSISFVASEHSTFFGGCATNIAYSLKILGENPVILGVAGNDFGRYADWLDTYGISTGNIYVDKLNPTAVATILSDKKQNQWTVFSPAAMKTHDVELTLKDYDFADLSCAIIGPELPARMRYFSRYFQQKGLKYLFDPGQVIHALTGEDLSMLAFGSFGLIVNEYEAELWHKKTGEEIEKLAEEVMVIKTLGADGSELFFGKEHLKVDAVKGVNPLDATGCGDAFRAGFLHGYVNGRSPENCLKLGSVMASFVLENVGTQTFEYSDAKFEERLSSLA